MPSKATPSEIIVWYILPALRKELVLELKALGLKQKQIAEKLEITEAAISQYVSSKRAAKNIAFNEFIKSELERSALLIKESTEEDIAFKELVRLADLCKNEKIICNSCGLNKDKTNTCCLCLENTDKTTTEYIG